MATKAKPRKEKVNGLRAEPRSVWVVTWSYVLSERSGIVGLFEGPERAWEIAEISRKEYPDRIFLVSEWPVRDNITMNRNIRAKLNIE